MKLNRSKLVLAIARTCMTDKELLIKAGIPRPTWSKIKSGNREPRPATIGKLAKALSVDVEYLIDANTQ